MNEYYMAAFFAFNLSHVRNRQYSNGIMELQVHAKLTLFECNGAISKRKEVAQSFKCVECACWTCSSCRYSLGKF